MKQIIYLNTDRINSYLSQLDNGLTTGSHVEVSDSTTSSKKTGQINNDLSMKLTVGVPFFNASIGDKGNNFSEEQFLANTESGKEIIDKKLYDNAYNIFFESIKNNISNIDEADLGDYVEVEGKYKLIDLSQIIDMLNDNNLEVLIPAICGVEFGMKETKEQRSEINKQKQVFKKIRNIFEFIKVSLPYDKLMVIEDNLIPLDEKYLRESVKAINFKYSQNIKVLGKFTKSLSSSDLDIEENDNSSLSSALDGINIATNSMLIELLGLTTSFLNIVDPIALYFE